MKTLIKTTSLFVPILRTEEHPDYTLVEGHAYVNARVRTDRYNLTRKAMERMAADWMTDGPTIKEMHRADTAAGLGIDHAWDEKGLKITAKVVDSEARKKVQQGVYRGFSVGVRPTVLRGDEVIEGRMPEISLVDRPADPEARFSCVRAEGELPAEVEAEVEEDDRMERADVERDYVARTEHVAEIARMTDQISALETERDEAKTELTRKEGETATLTRRVKELEALPAGKPVVRFTEAVQRTFLANEAERTEADEARAEIARIEAIPHDELTRMTQEERSSLVVTLGRLKQSL